MTNPATALDLDELSCVVIPTPGESVLLPNVCVAEIVPWRRIKPIDETPAWCMGVTGWRGQTIPVVHFSGFANEDAQPKSARCMVVMNRARNASAPPFYALAADGLPRMLQLADDDLRNESAELGPAEVMRVAAGTEIAVIPDLAYIESCVFDLVRQFRR